MLQCFSSLKPGKGGVGVKMGKDAGGKMYDSASEISEVPHTSVKSGVGQDFWMSSVTLFLN